MSVPAGGRQGGARAAVRLQLLPGAGRVAASQAGTRSISSLARAVTHPHICWPDLSSKHQTVHPPTHLQSGRSRGHSAPRARCPAAGAAAAARPPVPAVLPVAPSLRPACGAAGRLSHNRTAPSLRSTVIIDDRYVSGRDLAAAMHKPCVEAACNRQTASQALLLPLLPLPLLPALLGSPLQGCTHLWAGRPVLAGRRETACRARCQRTAGGPAAACCARPGCRRGRPPATAQRRACGRDQSKNAVQGVQHMAQALSSLCIVCAAAQHWAGSCRHWQSTPQPGGSSPACPVP